ncbi:MULTISPECIES: WhiB family transcriptional regulator [Actinomycetes]|uniref:Transcriptional regulator WhiB n=2 Tax=Actinomycetes TaxID=1760 RepID=A0ABP5YGP5_9ACTN|nr:MULTISPECIES: WhiB family transcriptional regulator [Streptomyces]MCE3029505.1 WhiB family transcriptional regulator [Streptomyces sp. CMSTAAHL-2]TGZ15681.1 transcriptional regulator WhiB [Streptomyces sp. S816]WDO10209.1 WhiB family transcriptional regulator [Streptomyces murinus]
MENWREHAECRYEDPDLFFPIGSTGPAQVQAERAKTVCERCPVRQECLDWALDTGQGIGIWGGTTELERRRLRRRTRSRPRSG